jgi:biopolymer transport protein ExbD
MLGRDLNSDANDNVSIDLSPMIDCIFILLIFFIVTTVFVDEVGTEVNKPDISSATASTLDNNTVMLKISADGKVRFDYEVIGVGGVQPLLKPRLDVDPDTSVVIQGHRDAPHGIVQRVHAEAKIAGAKTRSVSTLD